MTVIPGNLKVIPVDYVAPSYDPVTTSSPNQIVYNYASTLEIPPLFQELSWEKVTTQNSKFTDLPALYLKSDDGIFFAQGVKLSGQEWYSTERVFNSFEERSQFALQSYYYYQNKFTEIGWGDIQIPGYRLSGYIADGPYSSFMGNVGAKDGNVRAVVIDEERSQSETCPCTVTFNVFVSDIVTINELLKLAEAQKG